MRPRATPLRKLAQEIDAPVEAQAAILVDVNPLRLEVRWRVHDSDLSRLHEVIRDQQVLLVRADLDIMRSHDALVLIRVIEALDIVQVGNVERCDVVAERERKVCELTIVGDVGVDGEIVACAGTKVEEELGATLRAVCGFAERIDDPDLAGADSSSKCGRFLVTGDELYVLDAGAVGDGDSAEDLARAELPEAQRVRLHNARGASGFEDRDGYNEVRGEDDVVLVIDGEAVGRELLAEDVQRGGYIFGPLMDDVEVGIGFNEAARRSADSGAHVGDEEASIGLCANLVGYGREEGAV
jgi:hypothetical protein